MKKIICLLMTLVMVLSAFTIGGVSALAEEESGGITPVEMNKAYEAAFETTDEYSKKAKRYYDYYQFTMPANGKFTLKISSKYKGYKSQYARYYILSEKGNGTWSPNNKKFSGKWSAELKKGNYYFVAEYQKTNKPEGKMLGGSYTFKLSYSAVINKVQAKKAAAGKESFKASWKKAKGAAGYLVEYSRSKNFKNPEKVEVLGAKKLSATVKELESKKTYYVRVRGFKNVKFGEKTKTYYGKWSKALKVKTK